MVYGFREVRWRQKRKKKDVEFAQCLEVEVISGPWAVLVSVSWSTFVLC